MSMEEVETLKIEPPETKSARQQTVAPAGTVEEEPAPDPVEPVKAPPAKEAKEEKALTKYYVLSGPEEVGPYTLIGVVDASGQVAAKKAAVISVNEKTGNAHEQYFIAIPASSWIPQKPSVEVVTNVGFE